MHVRGRSWRGRLSEDKVSDISEARTREGSGQSALSFPHRTKRRARGVEPVFQLLSLGSTLWDTVGTRSVQREAQADCSGRRWTS